MKSGRMPTLSKSLNGLFSTKLESLKIKDTTFSFESQQKLKSYLKIPTTFPDYNAVDRFHSYHQISEDVF